MNTMVGLQASLHQSVGDDITELMKNEMSGLPAGGQGFQAASSSDDGVDFDPDELLKSPLFQNSVRADEKFGASFASEDSFGTFHHGDYEHTDNNNNISKVQQQHNEREKANATPPTTNTTTSASGDKAEFSTSRFNYNPADTEPTPLKPQDERTSPSRTSSAESEALFSTGDGGYGPSQTSPTRSSSEDSFGQADPYDTVYDPVLLQKALPAHPPLAVNVQMPNDSGETPSLDPNPVETPDQMSPHHQGQQQSLQAQQQQLQNQQALEQQAMMQNRLLLMQRDQQAQLHHQQQQEAAMMQQQQQQQQMFKQQQQIQQQQQFQQQQQRLQQQQIQLQHAQQQQMQQQQLRNAQLAQQRQLQRQQLQQRQLQQQQQLMLPRAHSYGVGSPRSRGAGNQLQQMQSYLQDRRTPTDMNNATLSVSMHGGEAYRPRRPHGGGGGDLSLSRSMHEGRSLGRTNPSAAAGAGGAPINEAMEKLCESMKRSAMSRSLVKQFSGRGLVRQNSARGGNALMRQNSARGLVRQGSQRGNLMAKQLSQRSLMMQNAGGGGDESGRNSAPIERVPPIRRTSNTKHHVGRGVYRSDSQRSLGGHSNHGGTVLQIDGRAVGTL